MPKTSKSFASTSIYDRDTIRSRIIDQARFTYTPKVATIDGVECVVSYASKLVRAADARKVTRNPYLKG